MGPGEVRAAGEQDVEEKRGGGEGEWGLCCNMMFILVMYLTVEDNRGLSVWLYEKNLNTNTKTFVDEYLREIL